LPSRRVIFTLLRLGVKNLAPKNTQHPYFLRGYKKRSLKKTENKKTNPAVTSQKVFILS
jgi:hypothetical protein